MDASSVCAHRCIDIIDANLTVSLSLSILEAKIPSRIFYSRNTRKTTKEISFQQVRSEKSLFAQSIVLLCDRNPLGSEIGTALPSRVVRSWRRGGYSA